MPAFAAAEPAPVSVAMRSNAASTSRSSSVASDEGSAARASLIAAPPMPIRPWRGKPLRKAIAVSSSSDVRRFSSAAR